MSIVKIISKNQEHVIDMGPVEAYVNDIEKCIQEEHHPNAIEQMKAAEQMSHKQLEYLVSMLSSKVIHYGDMFAASLTSQHQQRIAELRKLREGAKNAGIDLFPSLDK